MILCNVVRKHLIYKKLFYSHTVIKSPTIGYKHKEDWLDATSVNDSATNKHYCGTVQAMKRLCNHMTTVCHAWYNTDNLINSLRR